MAPVDANDARYLAKTLRILEETSAWAARISAPENGAQPAPKSSLCGDDDRVRPFRVSHGAWHKLVTAVDHLESLRVLLGTARLVPMFASFTLLRAALENSCAAVWLLEPAGRDDRLTRHLRMVIADIGHGEEAKALTGSLGPRPEVERTAQVMAIAAKAGLDEAEVRRSAPYSQIVRDVDEAGPANKAVKVCWRLCSAYAHGDPWATWGASQRTETRDSRQPGIVSCKVEANLSVVAGATELAVGTCRWGWRLYDGHCRSPYAG